MIDEINTSCVAARVEPREAATAVALPALSLFSVIGYASLAIKFMQKKKKN